MLGDFAARNAAMITYICHHFMGQEPDVIECLHDLPRGDVHDFSTFANGEYHMSLYRLLAVELFMRDVYNRQPQRSSSEIHLTVRSANRA
eukprot:6872-Eustigmatos_ZCMA.PRE.1